MCPRRARGYLKAYPGCLMTVQGCLLKHLNNVLAQSTRLNQLQHKMSEASRLTPYLEARPGIPHDGTVLQRIREISLTLFAKEGNKESPPLAKGE